jgi:uncharacterized membrane protein YuzA (DUF378 family)
MTDQANLERAYRRLLAWYPRAFRRESGQEFLGVLMASAPPGQRRPGLAESADLICNGLRMRLRPSVPRSARTVQAAVLLMYAGAAVSTVNLIMLLAVIAVIKASHVVLGHSLTAAQVGDVNALWITVSIVWSLVPIALWLWMAWACGWGRNWARILSTVLFGFATLDLTGFFGPPGFRVSLALTVFGPTVTVLYWLVGLAVVWLLWRPGSSAFFKPSGYTQAQHQAQKADRAQQAQMTELARIRSSRAQFLRQGVSRVDQPTRAADSWTGD